MHKGTLKEIELEGKILVLQRQIKNLEYALSCLSKQSFISEEVDPTVPSWVKSITTQDIENWNTPETGPDESLIIAYAIAL